MAEQKATNVHWHEGEISREHRAQLLGNKAATLWFTGLSGSGKSTIAVAVEKELHRRGVHSYRLDGDNVRLGINKDLGFSVYDRTENIRRIGEISKLFVDSGIVVLSSFISPFVVDRGQVRALHESSDMDFIEIYVDCSLDEAEKRDPKGLYKKARAGLIKSFTGLEDSPYEAPVAPEIHLRTDQQTLEEEVKEILDFLNEKGIIVMEKEK